MIDAEFKYNAFISYSQNPDKKLAQDIEESIERFGLGWHRLKKQQLYIFRDMTDLSLTKNLDGKIKEGLEQSEYLIVLAQKKLSLTTINWVNQETEYFIRLCNERQVDPYDYIILVITDGEIEWDREKNDWNFERTNVLPTSLQKAFIAQPLYVDLRGLKSEITPRYRKQLFNDAIIIITARLLKKTPSEIQSLIIQLQRVVIVIGAIIAFALLGSFIVSVRQTSIAKVRQAEAYRSATLAKISAYFSNESAKIARNERVKADQSRKTADDSAVSAKIQRRIAITAQDTAEKQRFKAKISEAIAIKERDTAKVQTQKAKTSEQAERKAKLETDTLNKLILSENLALTAINFFSKPNEPGYIKNITFITDSVLKANMLFDQYKGLQKNDYTNKLEVIYTSLQAAYISNMQSAIKLTKNYSNIFINRENLNYLLDLKGNIHLLDIQNKHIDTTLAGYKNKYIYEIVPVAGTNYIFYSNKYNNWEAYDVKNQITLPVLGMKPEYKSVVNTAYLNKETRNIVLATKKGDIITLEPLNTGGFTIKSVIHTSFNITCLKNNNTGQFLLSEQGEFGANNLCKNCFNPKTNKISSFDVSQGSDQIFLGFTNGIVSTFNVKTNHSEIINKFDNRINKIVWADNFNILIIQEGANKIFLYESLNNKFIRIFQSSFGQSINDLALDKNGILFILFDKNKLKWWQITRSTMANNLLNFHKQIANYEQ